MQPHLLYHPNTLWKTFFFVFQKVHSERNLLPQDPFFMEKLPSQKSANTINPLPPWGLNPNTINPNIKTPFPSLISRTHELIDSLHSSPKRHTNETKSRALVHFFFTDFRLNQLGRMSDTKNIIQQVSKGIHPSQLFE